MKNILFAFPTAWDRRQLPACQARFGDRFRFELGEPASEDVPYDFDIEAAIDDLAGAWPTRLDGITSSSDYPGATTAAAIATSRGLPGPRPEAVLACSHKWLSREVQRRVVPEATPWFALIDSAAPEEALDALSFPCFVKPVKGAFSVHSRRFDTADDLVACLRSDPVREFTEEYMRVFDRLLARFTDCPIVGRYFLAEGLLHGRMATVEGFAAAGGRVELLGIVDSTVQSGTGSFLRFDYPSELPEAVRRRMEDITRAVVPALGLRSALFNIEMLWDGETDAVSIFEVNPRMCGQFADLYEKVDGTNGYEVALALAAGESPRRERGAGRHRAAASFPLRVFEPVRVAHAPPADTVMSVEAEHPGTLIWNECESGQELGDFARFEDGSSYRYGVVNLGAESRSELDQKLASVLSVLAYDFAGSG